MTTCTENDLQLHPRHFCTIACFTLTRATRSARKGCTAAATKDSLAAVSRDCSRASRSGRPSSSTDAAAKLNSSWRRSFPNWSRAAWGSSGSSSSGASSSSVGAHSYTRHVQCGCKHHQQHTISETSGEHKGNGQAHTSAQGNLSYVAQAHGQHMCLYTFKGYLLFLSASPSLPVSAALSSLSLSLSRKHTPTPCPYSHLGVWATQALHQLVMSAAAHQLPASTACVSHLVRVLCWLLPGKCVSIHAAHALPHGNAVSSSTT